MNAAKELALCHTQLLNNLAVAVACCSGVDAAISILRDGLQQYPTCLAIKFNLVLLLWRKGDKSTACTLWMQARGWSVQGKANDSDATRDFDGQDGISAQQLAYLDALVLSYWRESRNFQLVESSRQYVEYLESLGTTNLPKNN
ncbi:uncharacterized protein PITG_10137 [Phytophthora infestans T30-4]|uniref:Uncharacterized protein n=1 Tax=Phytophthora infestans (strain T30-4) TaxID=403677 RepID=D0NEE5_PHYIT|nr:uncharacterized protein PITG_10137 [Phytophthora infestans T30-4]EEY56590.1 hypothetical protein PITG_10137 [Phytophthora infestans T30-4]|eukprot:XP_002902664.1 hypothetical protein PITG_10137 [Phytophthora infestans T30-4]